MRITVEREIIIEALRDEPLLSFGDVFLAEHLVLSWRTSVPIEKAGICKVCATGSVLLKILDKTQPASGAYEAMRAVTREANMMPSRFSTYASEALALIEEHPMNALSVFFEGAVESAKSEKFGPNTSVYDLSPEDKSAVVEVARARTIRFVDNNFPATIKLDIGDAVPSDYVLREG